MKTWINISCPVCHFRHPLRRFTKNIEPIEHPLQLVTGGGRAKGFHVMRYIPWSELPTFRQNPEVWTAVNSEYLRLSFAYDRFYTTLGFLSPEVNSIIESLEKEVFRLRVLNKELLDQFSRQSLLVRHDDKLGEFSGLLEKAQRRDKEDHHTANSLLT